MSSNDNPTFDTTDGSSWRGSRGQHLNASAAVPSYRQATTTYRAPADAESASNPSYRVATDEPGKAKPPGARAGAGNSGGGGFVSDNKVLILVVVCIALGVLCIILLALAINYGVAYQDALRSTPAPQVGRAQESPGTTTPPVVTTSAAPLSSTVSRNVLGVLDQSNVTKYVLRNNKGTEVDLISLGARVNAIRIKSASGPVVDVVAGTDESNVTNFQQNMLGAVNGKVCSAVVSSFTYNGVTYNLAKGQDGSSFYRDGGADGFYKKNYEINYVDSSNRVHFLLNGTSNENGAAVAFYVHVIYELTADNELVVSMSLVSDSVTPVDLCSSINFNLGGESSGNIDGHMLQIFSTAQNAVDNGGTSDSIGEIRYLQYQTAKSVSDITNFVGSTMKAYDYTFAISRPTGKNLLASLSHSTTNIALDIYSNQPALRFVVPRIAAGAPLKGKNGPYVGSPMFLAQPQQYPVLSNTAQNLSSIMLPLKSEYRQQTSYRFTV